MTRPLARDLLLALALALVLGAAWTARDWTALTALRLPDTDDVMRLVQVRDWIGGQRWSDLTQHRLGDGLPMHWTRLGDLGPAGMILTLAPLVGGHDATVAAVILYPILLFAVALVLLGRIARAIDPALAGTAIVVAALAYPASAMFLPGRIDHHGLQLVLALAGVLAAIGPPTRARGAAVGVAAAASLVVGLETSPFMAVLGLIMVGRWVKPPDGPSGRGSADARAGLMGLGSGALAGLVAALAFAPDAFNYPACDGWTRQAWSAAMIAAAVPLSLAFVPAPTMSHRLGWAAAVAVIGVGAILIVSPACLDPYGTVDARLKAAWLVHVGEAQPLFAAPATAAIGYAGLLVIGLGATAWQVRRSRSEGWTMLAALIAASLVLTLVQLRGAYVGALLAAPAIAAVIAAGRRRGVLALAVAWIGGAGIVYPAVGAWAFPARPDLAAGDCLTPALVRALGRLPRGEVLAPVDAGPAILLETQHRVLAGPYHRNAVGNLRALGLYAGRSGPPARYLLSCPAAVYRGRTDMRQVARDGDAHLWVLSGAPRDR